MGAASSLSMMKALGNELGQFGELGCDPVRGLMLAAWFGCLGCAVGELLGVVRFVQGFEPLLVGFVAAFGGG